MNETNKPIATYSRTNQIMQKYGLFTKKSFGQNFIIEPSIVENIADKSQLSDTTAVIEIGPGIGALTEQLAKRAQSVLCFEIDTRLIEVLKDTLSAYDNVTVVNQDFLEVDLKSVVDQLKSVHKEVVVAANLPYYITTPILFKIFESDVDISYLTVMMQKEVADRFSASVNSKDYNALSVIVQYLYDVKVVMKIPKTIFNPKPNVDSSVVQFKKKTEIKQVEDTQAFFNMVKGCFKQRRKTMLNNYGSFLANKEKALENLTKSGISEKARAESLTLEQFIELYEVQNEK